MEKRGVLFGEKDAQTGNGTVPGNSTMFRLIGRLRGPEEYDGYITENWRGSNTGGWYTGGNTDNSFFGY